VSSASLSTPFGSAVRPNAKDSTQSNPLEEGLRPGPFALVFAVEQIDDLPSRAGLAEPREDPRDAVDVCVGIRVSLES
jgi:hypothetical protein